MKTTTRLRLRFVAAARQAGLLSFLALGLSACSSHQFVNKTGQSEQQFIQDQAHCRALATGQGEGQAQGQRLIPYDECMRKLGYSLK